LVFVLLFITLHEIKVELFLIDSITRNIWKRNFHQE
jgi:hypothetical protein